MKTIKHLLLTGALLACVTITPLHSAKADDGNQPATAAVAASNPVAASDITFQTDPGPAPFDAAKVSAFVQPFIDTFAGKYGGLAKALAVIASIVGILRIVFKPLMLIVEAVVKNTKSTTDDAKLAAFERGPIYKWLVWGLDWVASVKPPATPTTNPLVGQNASQ